MFVNVGLCCLDEMLQCKKSKFLLTESSLRVIPTSRGYNSECGHNKQEVD